PSTSVVPSVPVSSSEAPVPSAAPTYAPTTPHSGSKRGLSYNDASLTECFENSGKISWAYNWGTTPDGLPSSFEYVPTMWGLKYDFPTIWAKNAQAAIDAGSTCLFSFNEPDHVDQSGLSVPDAVVAYKKHMQPFAGKARIGSPSVTDGPAPMGLDYLDRFLSACSGCTVDFVNVHWYNSVNNVQYFKDHVTKAHTMSGKPVWVTEFGTTDGSPEQIAEFLREVMEWMDAQDFVERYAYFMAAEGKLVSGANLNTVGQAYAS
ncbi:glycoside hydrolase family 128 protein, partial [Patellaria atrata CBS 101060]